MKTIDKQISELHSSLMITLDKFCPMKKVKPSKRKNWIDNEIKKETTKKKQLRRKMNEIDSEGSKLAYKKQSNLVKNLVRKKRWTFDQEKLHVESRQNSREFFIIYNELMGKSQKPEQDIFTQNQVENFNNFFASIGKKLSSEIEPNNKTNYHRKTSTLSFLAKLPKKK